MNENRKLATIRQINNITTIEGADQIELASVDGWSVVVEKGLYNVGDKIVYCEIDSFIPHDIAPFLSKGQEPTEYMGVKGEVLKTKRIRKVLSQGLILGQGFILKYMSKYYPCVAECGTDMTDFLGIILYEKPIPKEMQGSVKGNFPSFIPKTKQERVQNVFNEILQNLLNDRYVATEKLDGMSMTVYIKNGQVGVCSRNYDLEDTKDSIFWRAARDSGAIDAVIEFYEKNNKEIALQGEIVGEGIQGNPYKIKGNRFYVFDEFFIDLQKYVYGDVTSTRYLTVPKVDILIENITLEKLLKFADGKSLINPDVKREGIVFRHKGMRDTFKVISNEYLLKERE
jgi:RNA ligase (TIGR02306 family)